MPVPSRFISNYRRNEKARLEKEIALSGAGSGPPPGSLISEGEDILDIDDLKRWIFNIKEVAWPLLGLGGVVVMGALLAREAEGKPTLISKFVGSPLAAETADGLFDFMSSAAKASVSSPALRVVSALVMLKGFEKMGWMSEGAVKGAWATVCALEGASAGANILEVVLPWGKGDANVGPTSVSFSDTEGSSISEMPAEVYDLIRQNGYALPGVKRAALKP